MNPFKFRVWARAWKPPRFVALDELIMFGSNPTLKDVAEMMDTNLYVSQPYTGANDSTGQEIYVGDIVSFQDEIRKRHEHGEVIYSSEYLTYLVKVYQGNNYYSEYLCDLRNRGLRMLVIGNIYQNKDLLNQ